MRTPLYDKHIALGARMVDFADWEMPLYYTGIIAEHAAVRNRAGLFDVSHMGEILIEGPKALSLVQKLTTNDASALNIEQAQYTFLCNESGGIIDDCTLYRLSENSFLFVVNASNIKKDFDWISGNKGRRRLQVRNLSSKTALIALQGPFSRHIMESILPASSNAALGALKYYRFWKFSLPKLFGESAMYLSRTGYTGEDGFEIYCDAKDAALLWDLLLYTGRSWMLVPCGLGARNTLRLEAGMALYGNDLDENHTPLEANLGRFVKLQNTPNFIGKNALLKQSKHGIKRKLSGFEMEGREIAREHYDIYTKDKRPIGSVASGSPSPTLKRNIGMGYLPPEFSKPGTEILIQIRGTYAPAKIVQLPFYKRPKKGAS